ncbi:MAG: hypothetical protein U9M95_04045 [Candidatus Altiarchaeota archaeon]|nr:hypothetical protein [Candidatus Altiarchaeota archaeon]
MDWKEIWGIMLYGSMWGFTEATLGVMLHLMHYPLKGPVLMSVGVFLMAAALRMYQPKNAILYCLSIGLVASLLKVSDVFLVGFDVMVLRPMISILVEALAFGLMMKLLQKHEIGDRLKYPAAGAGYAYISYAGFALLLGVAGLGSRYWSGKTLTDLMYAVASDGTTTALMSVFMVSAGLLTGSWLQNLGYDRYHKPMAVAVILVCWVLGLTFT